MQTKYSSFSDVWVMARVPLQYKTIFLDLSFQRKACWPLSAKKNYIQSILEGVHPGYLILADVRQNAVTDPYFKQLQDKGMEYLSIDGNNRTTTLNEFMKNEFTVLFNGKKVMYKDLDLASKTQFDAKTISIVVYNSIDREGCAKIFLAHNESQALSKQEKRNAHIGEISTYFRGIEYLHSKIKTFSPDNKRRANDEYILDMLLATKDPFVYPTKKLRDEFWMGNLKEISFSKPYLEASIKLLGKLLNLNKFGSKLNEGLAKDFTIIRGLMKLNNITILDESLFLNQFSNYRHELFKSKRLYEIVGRDGEMRKEQYSSFVKLSTIGSTYRVRTKLLQEILQKLEDEKIVSTKTTRTVNTSDPTLRKKLYDRQNGLCPATNKVIEDPLDGQLWEVDHIITLKENGPEFSDNMQLVDKTYNRRKGGNSNFILTA